MDLSIASFRFCLSLLASIRIVFGGDYGNMYVCVCVCVDGDVDGVLLSVGVELY